LAFQSHGIAVKQMFWASPDSVDSAIKPLESER
jgi:hypothetical protein